MRDGGNEKEGKKIRFEETGFDLAKNMGKQND